MKESPDFRPTKEDKLQQLGEWREDKENSPYDYDRNDLANYILTGKPFQRKNIGNQALVITYEDVSSILAYLEFMDSEKDPVLLIIDPEGNVIHIDLECIEEHDVLIIYPHELGDEVAEK